ncbi:toxin-antitoxin system HicB family antitoxin [Rhizobium sp. BK661]|uniref:toxin-antitoxin system HicB family antitoxin n=1 Tax=Rhizobium sp. BK661 TaxID=2586991 RepID=UPI00386528FA
MASATNRRSAVQFCTRWELRKAFQEAVYLKTWKNIGKAPQRPYSGDMMRRVAPELHRRAALAAEREESCPRGRGDPARSRPRMIPLKSLPRRTPRPSAALRRRQLAVSPILLPATLNSRRDQQKNLFPGRGRPRCSRSVDP